MDLTFDLGDPASPRAHALVYFGAAGGGGARLRRRAAWVLGTAPGGGVEAGASGAAVAPARPVCGPVPAVGAAPARPAAGAFSTPPGSPPFPCAINIVFALPSVM